MWYEYPRISPVPFGVAVARINDDLKRTRACFLNLLPVGYPTGPQTMQTTPDTSDFSQARLAECFKYIRGAKTLNLPPAWKEIIPSFLPERQNSWEESTN